MPESPPAQVFFVSLLEWVILWLRCLLFVFLMDWVNSVVQVFLFLTPREGVILLWFSSGVCVFLPHGVGDSPPVQVFVFWCASWSG